MRSACTCFGYAGKIEPLRALYAQWGALAILIKGLTPIPFKLVTILSGAMHLNLAVFVAACAVTRAGRFFLVAGLFKFYGPTIAPVIERRIGIATALLAVLVIGAVVALKFLH